MTSQQTQLAIKGMTCAGCAQRIEKVLGQLPGVSRAGVNFATQSAQVQFDPGVLEESKVYQAIRSLGYEAALLDPKALAKPERSEAHALGRRFWVSLVFTIPVFVLSMGHGYMPFVPSSSLDFSKNFNLILFILSTPVVLWGGRPFYSSAVQALRYRTTTMNTLVTLGIGSTYLYSTVTTFFPSAGKGYGETYFETAAVLVTVLLLGRLLEAKARHQTTDAIQAFMKLQPQQAAVLRDGVETAVSINDVKIGDRIRVRPGETIPVDGVVVEGKTAIDESLMTGESELAYKQPGDRVIGGTLNQTGSIVFEVTCVGQNSQLQQIIRMVQEAQGSKAPIQRLADKVSGIFVPAVLAIAVVTFLIWMKWGSSWHFALLTSVSVLMIACPCALGLATPTALVVALGKAARMGIFIKNGETLEALTQIDTVLFDKTGTLTEGKPQVTNLVMIGNDLNQGNDNGKNDKDGNKKDGNGIEEEKIKIERKINTSEAIESDTNKLLQYIASIETASEHGLAKAIADYVKIQNIPLLPIEGFKAIPGQGIMGLVEDHMITIGNIKLMESQKIPTQPFQAALTQMTANAKTPVLIALDEKPVAVIAVSDPILDHAAEALDALKNQGYDLWMLTGDHPEIAQAVAKQVGIPKIKAGLMPIDKLDTIRLLQLQQHSVAMVGDGINDAAALAHADVGIAMGSGTDVTVSVSSVTLIHKNLWDVVKAIDISKKTMAIIRQNLFFAFFFNALGIPIAAGALYPMFGILLNPMIAGAAMAMSSVLVVTNSLRLKRYQ